MKSGGHLVTVVHLVRGANGVAPVRRFVDSYLRYQAGVDHALRIIFKGPGDYDSVGQELARTQHAFDVDRLADTGVDIGAYLASARNVSTDLACFVNSYSEIVAPEWLSKLASAAEMPGVGIAGATASYESLLVGRLRLARKEWRGMVRRPKLALSTARDLLRAAPTFPLFPNPHVRSNAFVLRTALFRQLRLAGPGKEAAWAFESGYASMTRQLRRRGLRPVVVGADGAVFEQRDWPASDTFRCREQRNLLVHDNQTRRYQDAEADEREYLRALAWGGRSGARP